MASKLSAAEEEAIIRKRFLAQTVATSAALVPPFKKLVTKYAMHPLFNLKHFLSVSILFIVVQVY